MTPCISDKELAQLVAGELVEGRAQDVRAHQETCARCKAEHALLESLARRVAAPVAQTSAAQLADEIMEKISMQRPAQTRSRKSWVWAGTAFVAAAVVLLLVALPGDEQASRFQARGSGTKSWKELVGLRLHRVTPERSVLPLKAGATISAGDGLVVSYWSTRPNQALVFAVDANKDVHWLYPAYLDADTNPASVPLDATDEERFFRETVVLDSPALGELQIVWIVSPEAMHVSDIERLSAKQLGEAALKSRFPSALVDSLSLRQEASR